MLTPPDMFPIHNRSLLMQLNSMSEGKTSWSILRKYIERQPCYPVKSLPVGGLERADDAMRDDIML